MVNLLRNILMEQLLPITNENASTLTMSSREIAELCEKEHRHVARDIEVMFEQLEINPKGYVQIWTHPQNGQSYREFMLPKDLTLTLVAGYSVKLRKRIIDRWLELENQQNPTALLPQNYLQALEQLVASEKEKQALALENKAMIAALERDKALYRQSGNLIPYSDKQSRGLFTVKTGTAEHGHNFTQTRVTSKGIQWIAQRYASELML